LTEGIFFMIEKTPKSARRGSPCSPTRMLDFRKVRGSVFVMVAGMVGHSAYGFQVSMNHLIGVEIVEAMRDTKQLSIGDEDRSMPRWKAGELTRFN